MCDDCSYIRVSYNSCRNRHCPKCQQINKERWIIAREADLLPVGYFHVVFTLPDTLNPYCHKYPKALYDLLFRSVRETIFAFSADPRHLGAETGYIAVLHTWGQTLTLHLHLHCIIPAGGITIQGNKQKLMTLDATEFLRRLCLHILPQRFVKIRHYGFLSSRRKAAELPVLQGKVTETGSTEPLQPTEPQQKLSWQEISRKRLNFDPDVCPCCQKGRMRTIEILPPRSPPNMLKNQLQTNRK